MLGKLHLSSMPHGPLFMMIHTMAACITKASWGEGLLASKEVTILCNIIMEMTSHYLCHILLVRSTCMFPHSKGIAQGQSTGGRVPGGRLQVAATVSSKCAVFDPRQRGLKAYIPKPYGLLPLMASPFLFSSDPRCHLLFNSWSPKRNSKASTGF